MCYGHARLVSFILQRVCYSNGYTVTTTVSYCCQEKLQSSQQRDQDGGSLLANLQERLVQTDQGAVVLSSNSNPVVQLNSSQPNNAGKFTGALCVRWSVCLSVLRVQDFAESAQVTKLDSYSKSLLSPRLLKMTN